MCDTITTHCYRPRGPVLYEAWHNDKKHWLSRNRLVTPLHQTILRSSTKEHHARTIQQGYFPFPFLSLIRIGIPFFPVKERYPLPTTRRQIKQMDTSCATTGVDKENMGVGEGIKAEIEEEAMEMVKKPIVGRYKGQAVRLDQLGWDLDRREFILLRRSKSDVSRARVTITEYGKQELLRAGYSLSQFGIEAPKSPVPTGTGEMFIYPPNRKDCACSGPVTITEEGKRVLMRRGYSLDQFGLEAPKSRKVKHTPSCALPEARSRRSPRGHSSGASSVGEKVDSVRVNPEKPPYPRKKHRALPR